MEMTKHDDFSAKKAKELLDTITNGTEAKIDSLWRRHDIFICLVLGSLLAILSILIARMINGASFSDAASGLESSFMVATVFLILSIECRLSICEIHEDWATGMTLLLSTRNNIIIDAITGSSEDEEGEE